MRKTAQTIRVLAATVLVTLAVMPCRASADEAQEAWSQGNAACLRGEFDLAVRHFSDAIRLNPQAAVTYNNRGYAYLQTGDLEKALADYNEALRRDPRYAKAHFFRGSAYEDKGEQAKAVADYTAAMRLDPKYARAYCSRGPTAKAPAMFADGPAQASQEADHVPRGVNYFVASNGDDRNPGTMERPFATLYKAHQQVRPGDTINLRAGTYKALISWTKSGTPAAPITIQAYMGEDVTLESSEQYTWTRVTDPTFGDCWKVVIPQMPIKYPGLQHTVWEDVAHAGANPNIEIWAIVKGGYMCARMHAAEHFARPQAAPGIPLTDKGGNLKFPITWYDRNMMTLWFKPGPSRVTDPSNQLYVTSGASGQFSLGGSSYLKFTGLKFKYLCYLHQYDYPTGCEIHNCEFKHAYHGICGSGKRCAYTSLLVDKLGDCVLWRDAYYDRAYLCHGFYFNGLRCVVSNCFFGRSNKGGPIQNWPHGVSENVFDGNVLYNSDGGSIFMGSGKNYITNNISLQKKAGIGPYFTMQGFTFANNYSESAVPFRFDFQEAKGAYAGTFEKFAITGNVLNNTGGWIDYRGNVVDAKSCKIDGNVYLGRPGWHLGLTQADPPKTAYNDYTSYASYVAALQALPNCGSWEKKSQAGSAAPRFDFTSFDAFLDSDPPLAAVLLKTRQYVKSVTAPFPGAGPAIDLPVAGAGKDPRL